MTNKVGIFKYIFLPKQYQVINYISGLEIDHEYDKEKGFENYTGKDTT